ncbi:MAG: VIT1/CCC1 transporter family protein [Candidatus Hodarchaeales archaeon]|jgi:predicted membrane protein (TIGR00267 family)
MKSLKQIRDLIQLGGGEGIAKRYMVMNSFDGALTALGIIIGSFLVGVTDPRILIVAGLGASIAMGVSGGFGAYLTESAVKKEEIAKGESAMLEEFEDTVIDEAAMAASYFVAFVDGFSPFMAASISFLPFIAAFFFDIGIQFAYFFSVILTTITLFVLGAYLGKISNDNKIKYGIRMIFAGIITGILVFLVELLSQGH